VVFGKDFMNACDINVDLNALKKVAVEGWETERN